MRLLLLCVLCCCRCCERVISRKVAQLALPVDLAEPQPEESERVQVGVYATHTAHICLQDPVGMLASHVYPPASTSAHARVRHTVRRCRGGCFRQT